MTCVLMGEAQNSPDGKWTSDGFEGHRYFKVLSNSFLDGQLTAINAVGIRWGNQYVFGNEIMARANAKDFSAKRIEPNSLIWLVDVIYRTPSNRNKDKPDDQHSDPKFDAPKVRITSEEKQIAATELDDDDNESSITASNGEPFLDPPSKEDVRRILTITINQDISTPTEALIAQYQNHINSDEFWGQDPYTYKCKTIDPTLKTRNLPDGTAINYLEVDYVFSFKWDSWDVSLQDMGSYSLDDFGNKLPFLTAAGTPYIGLLNGSGGESATPVNLPPKRIYSLAAFAGLNLPQSFAQCIPFPSN